jgi:hypothetical protein
MTKQEQLRAAARLLGRRARSADGLQALKPAQAKAARRAASLLARAQWEAYTAEERSAIMRATQNGSGGRPRATERCWCGRYARSTAELRRFDCCKRAGVYPVQGPAV